jgi:hypothetical protein
MSKPSLSAHISDLITVQRHVGEAIQTQLATEEIKHYPAAQTVLEKTAQTLEWHRTDLERHLEELGGRGAGSGSPMQLIKDTVAAVAGAAAGIYDTTRDHSVSRMLRDDYTALSLLAISCSLLNATALAKGDDFLGRLAAASLEDLAEFIKEIGRIAPVVAISELARDPDETVDRTVTERVLEATAAAWRRDG